MKSFSGSSLKKSSAISGSFRLPALLVDGILLGSEPTDYLGIKCCLNPWFICMNGASSAWITARERLQSFTDYPLLKDPQRNQQKSSFHFFPSTQPHYMKQCNPSICWDGKVPLRWQWSISTEHNSKPKHRMRRIPSPSICSITCREVSSVTPACHQ